MRKIFIKSFAILSCILSLAAIGNAQSVKNSEFQIPFDFIFKDKVFPAGKYSIERLNQSNPNLLILKSANGKEKTVFLTQNSDEKQPNQMCLSFKQLDGSYFLESVRLNQDSNGQKVLLNVSVPKLSKTQKI